MDSSRVKNAQAAKPARTFSQSNFIPQHMKILLAQHLSMKTWLGFQQMDY